MTLKDYIKEAGFLKVRSCPFCETNGNVIERNKIDKFRIRCKVCGTRQAYIFDSPIKAAQKWNKRYESKKFKITKIVNGEFRTHIETEDDFYFSLLNKKD